VRIDDGIASVTGQIDPAVQPAFDRWVASTPQITGGNLRLAEMENEGAHR